MPRFAANLSMMFPELPFLERFGAAQRAGFQAVEFMFPYEHPASAIAEQLEAHDLLQVLFNLPPGDWSKGERGLACLPDRGPEFEDGVGRAVEYATALRCPRLNCLSGIRSDRITPSQGQELLLERVRFAANFAASAGITLMIEPLNSIDVPGFFLARNDEVAAILSTLSDVPNVALQFDAYHTHMMGEDVVAAFDKHQKILGHVQVSDVPGRHEPGSGEIDFAAFFAALDARNYDGWVGCEYRPKGETLAGLGWLKRYSACFDDSPMTRK